VVPDFTLDLLNAKVKPTIYLVDFANYPADQVLNIKLDGQKLPETLAKIDGLWKQTGQEGVIHRQFVDEYVQQIYLGTIRQGYLITALSAIALFLACFGLLGLAAFTTERRTREIGVRKAMGAATSDILKLLMWQFTKPVLWGILVAWPLAWWLMSRWLEGFAYRVALSPLIFFGAACGAVMVAWTTVGSRAWLAARARPVQALRHD
jgi:putative ABC transport system permease protein